MYLISGDRMKFLLAVLFIGCYLLSYGQDQVVIRMSDRLSEEPIPGAQVINLADSAKVLANSRGFAQLSASMGDSVVITADNYQTGMIVVPESERFQAGLDVTEEALAFEGSIKAFFEQLGKALRYPRIARSDGLQKVTFTSFVINQNGEMTDFRSLAPNPSVLEREVVRVLSKLKGTWSSAYQGKRMTLPVVFQIAGSDSETDVEDVIPEGRLLSEVVVAAYAVSSVDRKSNR